jgi:hypothetical protein
MFGERRSVYRTYGEYESMRGEKFAKPVELLDYWGRVPNEFALDGITWRIITIANGRKLLRSRPLPFFHGELPFLAYSPMPDPHFFHGPGKIEIGEKMQFAANRIANQKMDGIDVTIDPMWLVDRGRGIDTQNLISRAGRVIGVDGPVDDTVIRPLSPDLRGLQMAYTEIQQLWGWIQQGTGMIEDTVMGMGGGSDRQTAYEFKGRQENVLTRLMLEARLAEEGFVEPLANMFRALNKQFLKVPKEVRIMGSDAVVNPITGFPLPQEPVQINLEDFYPDYRARAVGATQMLSRALKQQNLLALLQVMGSNPTAAAMVNWTGFFRQIFETLDLKNPDELLLTAPTQLNQLGAGDGRGQSGDEALSTQLQGGDMPPEVMQQVQAEMMGSMQ